MRNAMVKSALVGMLIVLAITCASAQQIYFPGFSSMAYLQTNFSKQAYYNNQYVLRLTPGAPPPGTPRSEPASSTWFNIQQPVGNGFTTYFRFQIHNAQCCNPGEGLAFVVQNAASTDPSYGATGAGLTARGVANGGLGYAGIPNSLAIEFDVQANQWDPTLNGNNHVAVQSCGTHTNGPVHTAGTYTIYKNNNVTSCLVNNGINNSNSLPHLGVTCNGGSCADGLPHDVVVEYGLVGTQWALAVYVDPQFTTGTHTPIPGSVPAVNVMYNIDGTQNPSTGLNLNTDSNGKKTLAWVGFTGAQSAQAEQEDILFWEFTPHTPTTVQQPVPNGCDPNNPACNPTNFNFGGHNTQVTMPLGYTNTNGLKMSVVATPTPRNLFWVNRLKGTPFANEQCIVYLGTGGNCVVYSVTCQDQNNNTVACPNFGTTCTNVGDPGCITFGTSFYTNDGVTTKNADYLKVDPVCTYPPTDPRYSSCPKNWLSIFVSYQPNVFDGHTTGTTPTPSDFVATFKVGIAP